MHFKRSLKPRKAQRSTGVDEQYHRRHLSVLGLRDKRRETVLILTDNLCYKARHQSELRCGPS